MRRLLLAAAVAALAAPAAAQASLPAPFAPPPADPAAHYWLGAGFVMQCGAAAAPACDPFLVGLVTAQDAVSVRTGALAGCPFLRRPLAEVRAELTDFIAFGGATPAAIPVAESFQRLLRARPELCRLAPPAAP